MRSSHEVNVGPTETLEAPHPNPSPWGRGAKTFQPLSSRELRHLPDSAIQGGIEEL